MAEEGNMENHALAIKSFSLKKTHVGSAHISRILGSAVLPCAENDEIWNIYEQP